MKSANEAQSMRRNLTLDGLTAKRLGTLRSDTEASSDSEVVRQALLYFEQLANDSMVSMKETVILNPAGEIVLRLALNTSPANDDTKKSAPVKRNLLVTEAASARIDGLRELTRTRSDSEVVRDAIAYYHLLVDHVLRGNYLAVSDADGMYHRQFIPVGRVMRPKIIPKMAVPILG